MNNRLKKMMQFGWRVMRVKVTFAVLTFKVAWHFIYEMKKEREVLIKNLFLMR